MRYRTGKTRSYISKRKDTKVTNKNTANTFESEPQQTQHNAAYKVINVSLMSGMNYSTFAPVNTCINHIIYPGQISPTKMDLYY